MDKHRRFVGSLVAVVALTGCANDGNTASAHPLTLFEAEILADGRVTRNEIESARATTVECLAAAGFQASFAHESNRVSALSVDSGYPAPGETDEDLSKRFEHATDQCANDYLIPIDHAWIKASAPSAQERRAAFRALQACVDEFGVELVADPPAGLRPLIDRLQRAAAADEATRSLSVCFASYSLTTATAEP